MKIGNNGGRHLGVVVESIERRVMMSAGMLDPTFGMGGQPVMLSGGGFFSSNKALVAQDSKGRVLVSESNTNVHSSVTIITRLNANGSIDTTFGTGGSFSYGNAVSPGGMFPPSQYTNRILPEPDGSVLLLGTQLQHVSGTGILDASFGGGTFDNGPSIPNGATSGALLSNGKFLVVDGSTNNVYRFNSNGTPDASFGTNGVLTLPSTFQSVGVQDVVINSSGQAMLSVAAQINNSTFAFGTARLTAAGKFDSSYGTGGYSLSANQSVTPASSRIALAPGGVVDQVATYDNSSTGPNIFVQAYSADGKHVGGGRYTSPPDAAGEFDYDNLTDLVVQSDGKVIAVGTATIDDPMEGETSTPIIERLNAISPASNQAITFDPTFNGSGVLNLPFSNIVVPPETQSVAFDGSGRILAGVADGDDLAVLRVLTAGSNSGTSVRVTGDVIGTPGSYRNQGNVAGKVFDGNLSTFFDAQQANGAWAGLDLGTARTITRMSYAPRSRFASRMIGGIFQGSSTADFTSGVQTLYTITTAPPAGQLTTVGIGNAGPFRCVRYLSPAGGCGNIAEAQFYATPQALAGKVIGTAGSYGNSGNTTANAFDGNLSTFFDAPTASGSWVGLDLGSAKIVTQADFAPRDSGYSGFAKRMIGGEIQASNSATFSSGVVTLYTITSAPQAGVLTAASLNNTTAYRYYRYIGPANSFCDIAELEFDG